MGQRLLSLDFIKMFAMFGVMCLHSEFEFYENPLAQFLYMSAVVSIPLFFMTSGYLLYGKSSVEWRYSVRKIYGILRFVAIMTVAFWLLTGMKHGVSFLSFTVGSLLQRGGLGVYWYFGSMIIIYALLPIIHPVYVRHQKIFLIATVALCVLSNCIFFSHFIGFQIEESTTQTFRLWNWVFYFNVGGLLRRYSLKSNIAVVLFLFAASYLFQFTVTPFMPTPYCEYFYSSWPIMLLSLFLFVYLTKIDNSKLQFVRGGVNCFFRAIRSICLY